MLVIVNSSLLKSSYVTENIYVFKIKIYILQLSVKFFYSIIALTGHDLPL